MLLLLRLCLHRPLLTARPWRHHRRLARPPRLRRVASGWAKRRGTPKLRTEILGRKPAWRKTARITAWEALWWCASATEALGSFRNVESMAHLHHHPRVLHRCRRLQQALRVKLLVVVANVCLCSNVRTPRECQPFRTLCLKPVLCCFRTDACGACFRNQSETQAACAARRTESCVK